MRGLKYLLSILLMLMLWSCIDEFDFKATPPADLLVIDGGFTTHPEPHYLKLSYASAVGSGPGRPVTNAIVKLYDETGDSEEYLEEGAGNYRLDGDILEGTPGTSYYLEIELSTGVKYRSNPEQMPELITADSVYWSVDRQFVESDLGGLQEKTFINIFLDSPTPGPEAEYWMRWMIDEAYSFPDLFCGGLDVPMVCYLTDIPTDLQLINIFDGTNSPVNQLTQKQITSKQLLNRSPAWRGRHYFNVYQRSITQTAYEYWDKADKAANQSGSIFDPPPASIRGNLYNTEDAEEVVLGIFELAAIDTVRTFLSPGEIDEFFFIYPYCLNASFPFLPPGLPTECCFCTFLDGASLERPYYW